VPLLLLFIQGVPVMHEQPNQVMACIYVHAMVCVSGRQAG
jgi:hypothetical protein